MADPYTIPRIEDLAIGASGVDILANEGAALMDEDSICIVYLNRESVDVEAQILAGKNQVFSQGPVAINATIGDGPIVTDDRVVIAMVKQGDRLGILGTNDNVAQQELRALVFVFAVDDVLQMPALLANV